MNRRNKHEHPAQDKPQKPSFAISGTPFTVERTAPGLYIVATPIGNLEDVTLRALRILAGADLVACEDRRVTRRLMERYAITTPLVTYNDHSGPAERRALIERAAGQAVALVSDAGTPLVSDPGYRLAAEAAKAGIAVTALPGPSSLLAALAVSGLPTDRFLFAGFLPSKRSERRARIGELASVPASLILFESPNRLAASLADLASALGARKASVARELTKAFETIYRSTLPDLATSFAAEERVRGEIVLMIAPPDPEAPAGEAQVDAMLAKALASMSLKDAAASVAGATGRPKRDVYARALTLAGKANG